ncbi:hypothetical protein K505DRAFT_348408 [Melanomma pulvis-pyrius CBS 109.77]|uniref:Uncharacterized protein n=1 Tax=Melanomma pulvis-pyrius CBS 109.77 TaxID=1314802 RepID=A0A6A6XHU8_9PLEO|nr:hypothetical protein K505DRAFT_348408 [Melanomma pulvis-pyrius CBS 109.77]
MTDQSSKLYIPPTRSLILPTIATLLGLTGVGGGVYTFISAQDAIRSFGLRPPPSSTKTALSKHADAFEQSMIHVYGIRNLGVGLSTLGLTAFWKLSPTCQTSPLAADISKKCLGICMMFGTLVALGDAWIVRQFGKSSELEEEARIEASKASTGHALVSVPILATGLTLFFS